MKNQYTQKLLEILEKYKHPVTDFYLTGSEPELSYYHVPVKDLGSLSLAYMSYNLYQTLNVPEKGYYSWINYLLSKKYFTNKLKYANVNPRQKEALLNLNSCNYQEFRVELEHLYDLCIESIILEIIIWKSLKELNRHKLALDPNYIPRNFRSYLSKLDPDDQE